MSGSVLTLTGIRKSFGPTEIIRGVDLTLEAGTIHALIGPNGAGKSTLFNLASGLLAPTAGDIRLKGERVTGLKPYEINRRGLSRSFQVTNIFSRLSVEENLRCAILWSMGYRHSFWHRVAGLGDVGAKTDQLLAEINLAHRRATPASALTYAEQRALEIGITIGGGADVILLDEPTAGMSTTEAQRAVDLIRAIAKGRTVMVIEHDMGVVFDLADTISVLVYGEVIASDRPAAIKQNARVQEAYLGTAGH
jgi:branched-chain amino acid transport system ATP-binding protein